MALIYKFTLVNVINLSGFDNEQDLLISLGDLSDRGEDSWGVVEFLINVKNNDKRRFIDLY